MLLSEYMRGQNGRSRLFRLLLDFVFHSQHGNMGFSRASIKRDDDIAVEAFLQELLLIPAGVDHRGFCWHGCCHGCCHGCERAR